MPAFRSSQQEIAPVEQWCIGLPGTPFLLLPVSYTSSVGWSSDLHSGAITWPDPTSKSTTASDEDMAVCRRI
ncbi:hypothetical protein N7488_002223 [Penicillium malachiteum]|nr:hypothetical protein N7488_002223 [Penicillium malachiteum]